MAGGSVGEQLASLRKARGWSLRAAARAMGWSSHAQLSEIERGRRPLPEARVADVARAFGLDDAAVRTLRAAVAAQSPPSEVAAPARGVVRLPARRDDFVGREQFFKQVGTAVDGRGRLVLTGLGGIGKTEVALELAHRLATSAGTVWWIDASAAGWMKSSLDDVAALLGEEAWANELWPAVAALGQAVLVYDDAPGAAAIEPFLPPPDLDIQVIITSRARDWPGATRIDVPTFEPAEAVDLLLAQLPLEGPEDALRLADRLGCLPLAIAQAAAYARQAGLSANAYLDLVTRRPALLDRGRPENYDATVTSTWRLNLDAAVADAATAQWLAIVAWFSPASIPLRVFSERAALITSPLRDVIDGDGLLPLLRPLEAQSLIRVEETTARMHPLVQEAVRLTLADSQLRNGVATAVSLLRAALDPKESIGPTHVLLERDVIPSFLTLASHAAAVEAMPAAVARLCWELGLTQYRAGDPPGACDLAERGLEIVRSHAVDDDATLAYDLFALLGASRSVLWDLEKAEAAFAEAVAALAPVADRYLKRDASALMNLGVIRVYQGRAEEGIPNLVECLRREEALVGPDAPELIEVLSNLTAAYVEVDRIEDAMAAGQRGLSLAQTLGDEPSSGAESILVNLGHAHLRRGELGEATAFLDQAVARIERARGPEHPTLIEALTTQGETLRQTGTLDAARAALGRAVALAEIASPDTPAHADAQLYLATVEIDAGRPKAALRLARSARSKLGDAPTGLAVALAEKADALIASASEGGRRL